MKSLVRIHQTFFPVKTLGVGNRFGVWFQGCDIGCKDCISPHTWDKNGGSERTISQLLDEVSRVELNNIDGISISGGEPFQQPDALFELVSALSELKNKKPNLDILVYSGYRFAKLKRSWANILQFCDVIISEPFINGSPPALFRGSNNQEMHFLSELARSKYSQLDQTTENSIQLDFVDGQIRLIGIPKRGEIELFKDKLRTAGMNFAENSLNS